MELLYRRRFLRQTGLAAAAMVSARPAHEASAQETAGTPKRVLVLGAGMSGLTAALALHRRGHDVQVLEHQDRVGGRLISVPLRDGQFTEGGGGHFRSNMPLVCGYIHRFRLPLLSLNDGSPRYHVGGRVGDAIALSDWPWAYTPASETSTCLPPSPATSFRTDSTSAMSSTPIGPIARPAKCTTA